MKLRKLEKRDAIYMLEWMHDPSVIKFMNTDFSSKKLVDCEKFIEKSQECISDLHMAISDDNDEYMGTVSLKNIDEIELCAEFAITIRKKGMGKGYAIWGMREILNKAFQELNLKFVYWYVSKMNMRAIKFYNKNEFKISDRLPEHIDVKISDKFYEDYYWYLVENPSN